MTVITGAEPVITDQIIHDSLQGHHNMNVVNSLILETGKLVLLILDGRSKSGFDSNVVFGWDQSREAGRAMQDAMPLLIKANHVDVDSVDCHDQDGSQITSYLNRRKVHNRFTSAETEGHFDGAEKELYNYPQKSSADLIVVGVYGHTRMREIMPSGVTRYPLPVTRCPCKHSTFPVLFSH